MRQSISIVPDEYLLATRDFGLFEDQIKEPVEDFIWLPHSEMELEWSIDPDTGEFTSLAGLKAPSGDYSLLSLPEKPPGFPSGLGDGNVLSESECESIADEECVGKSPTNDDTRPGPIGNIEQDVDSLLKGVESIRLVYSGLSTTTTHSSIPLSTAKKQQHWARTVDISRIPDDFSVVVPDPPAFQHPFKLDPFQQLAVYHMERGESVFVAAHTSAGKTAVAEYAVGMCRKHLTRAIYTSPIKALSNQKFRDFRETFGEDAVGLLTGDVQINPDAADCLIMTTEILRSMLYRDSDLIREVEWVIFDEVHYVNDAERGVVWEEVIIMLPVHVRLVLLSATTPNTFEFADWVGRTRGEIVNVIATLYRPVPLEHFLYYQKELFRVVDGQRNWIETGHKAAVVKHTQSGKSKQAVIGASVWIELVYFLQKRSLLPTVVFSFSRRRCEEYADALSGVDLNPSAADHATVHRFFSSALSKLSLADRGLPQVVRTGEMLGRGIAVHHSGLLPLLKETVEILFARGLVKILFATETFAMGVNMPARTVVFSGIKKHDGSTFRLLHPGEYTQMAGRAGRRGKDEVGTVIIMAGIDGGEVPSALLLQSLLLGCPTKLSSQFRLTYSMILGLLRVESFRVEEMLKKSFSENTNQKRRPEEEAHLRTLQKMVEECPEVKCPKCSVALDAVLEMAMSYNECGERLFKRLLSDLFDKLGVRYFEPGRILIAYGPSGNIPVLLLNSTRLQLKCLSPVPLPIDSVIPYPPFHLATLPRPLLVHSIRDCTIQYDHIAAVTRTKLPIPNCSIRDFSERQIIELKQQFAEFLSNPHNLLFVEQRIPAFKSLDLDESRITRELAKTGLDLLSECAVVCPSFSEHFAGHYQRATLISRLAEAQFATSDMALCLLPEYHSRVAILRRLQFVDPVSGHVLLKGRVGGEIRTLEGGLLLMVIEMLFSGFFLGLESPEIASLLSAFYFQEKVDEKLEDILQGLPETLKEACEDVINRVDDLTRLQRSFDVPVTADDAPLRFGLVQVVFFWARGYSFARIAEMTSVLEGTIVRCVVRLEEGLRELCHASKLMGDLELAGKFEDAAVRIKRDICFASSLYL